MSDNEWKKMFMDDLYTEVAFAIGRARDIQNKSRRGEIKRDAEFIEQTLIGVAEKLAANGQRAKEKFGKLIKSNLKDAK